MDKLRPCPFCYRAELEVQELITGQDPFQSIEYVVSCTWCGARGPNEVSEHNAKEMWNMRQTKTPKSGFIVYR